jgi:hypothetical protein
VVVCLYADPYTERVAFCAFLLGHSWLAAHTAAAAAAALLSHDTQIHAGAMCHQAHYCGMPDHASCTVVGCVGVSSIDLSSTNLVVCLHADPYTERVAFVLFCWVILEWLLPTLLLLPNKSERAAAAAVGAAAAERQQQQGEPEGSSSSSSGTSSSSSLFSRAADKLLAGIEAWLLLLQVIEACYMTCCMTCYQGLMQITSLATVEMPCIWTRWQALKRGCCCYRCVAHITLHVMWHDI